MKVMRLCLVRQVAKRGLLLAVMSACTGGQAQGLPPVRSIAEQYLFAAANDERVQRGLPALRWDQALYSAASKHARWMAADRSLSHRYRGEAELADRVQSAGVRFSAVTENVGEARSATELHIAWMNSPHHRENLLDANVDAVAISVMRRDGQLYAVEDFTHTVARLSLKEQEDAVVAALGAWSGVEVLPRSEDARQTCGLEHGYAGDRQPWFVMRYTTGDLRVLPSELREKMATGRFRQAAVGACAPGDGSPFSSYAIAVLLYP